MTTLFRAVLEVQDTTGRTLSGLAIPWNRPTRVRDLSGPAYMEAFSDGSADVSLRQHTTFPLFTRHDYSRDPIGVVTFQRSREGLIFEAPVSHTRDGDEALELVNDGAMRAVSVGFKPVNQVKRADVLIRTEIGLKELSLAATGFGQVPGAEVLAVREELAVEGTPVLDAMRRRASRIKVPDLR